MRYFNTAGPLDPQDHYCIPPLARMDLDYVLNLIRQEQYFMWSGASTALSPASQASKLGQSGKPRPLP